MGTRERSQGQKKKLKKSLEVGNLQIPFNVLIKKHTIVKFFFFRWSPTSPRKALFLVTHFQLSFVGEARKEERKKQKEERRKKKKEEKRKKKEGRRHKKEDIGKKNKKKKKVALFSPSSNHNIAFFTLSLFRTISQTRAVAAFLSNRESKKKSNVVVEGRVDKINTSMKTEGRGSKKKKVGGKRRFRKKCCVDFVRGFALRWFSS